MSTVIALIIFGLQPNGTSIMVTPSGLFRSADECAAGAKDIAAEFNTQGFNLTQFSFNCVDTSFPVPPEGEPT